MGLVICPDCGHEISDLAPACPQCARPMRVDDSPVTIEQTSKPYKLLQGTGLAGAVGGLVLMAWTVPLGALVAGAGALFYLSGAVGGWWHNG